MASPSAGPTASGSASGASSTHHAPSGKQSSRSAAVCAASRVLPQPPAPVSVSSRVSLRAAAMSSSSCSRPTKLVSCSGRLFGSASSERSGSALAGRSGWFSAKTCSGRPRSRSRWVPLSTSVTPAGSCSIDEVVHGAREQRLTTVGDPPQPRAATQRDAEVIALVAQLRLGGMQSDTHAQPQPVWPRLPRSALAEPRAPPPPRPTRARTPPRCCRPRPARLV